MQASARWNTCCKLCCRTASKHFARSPVISLPSTSRRPFATGRRSAQQDDTLQARRLGDLYEISGKRNRINVKSADTANKIVNAMQLDKLDKPAVVLDLYAGEGLLSEALLNHPNVAKVIGLDQSPKSAGPLARLVEAHAGRFNHICLDPFWWDAYTVIQQRGLLDEVERRPWDDRSGPADGRINLVLTGVMPNNFHTDKLVFQFLSQVTGQMWLYDLGRFSSYFVLNSALRERLVAKPGFKTRNKASVVMQLLTQINTLVSADKFHPTKDHFKRAGSAKAQLDYEVVEFQPHPTQSRTMEEMETLNMLTKQMFIHASQEWTKALAYLAPGAEMVADLVEADGHVIDRKKTPRDLQNREWVQITRAFLKWPFRPKDLSDSDILDLEASAKYDKRV